MEPLRIGQLRYLVTLYRRHDLPDPAPGATGVIEVLEDPIEFAADIIPTGPMVFFDSVNAMSSPGVIDRALTHRVFCRWFTPPNMATVDMTYVIERIMETPDGRTRKERFRVWRVMEVDGKTRFLQWDCMLEAVTDV
jgi:hypothetical protein